MIFHDNLYPQVCDWDNLLLAYRQASKGKRKSSAHIKALAVYRGSARADRTLKADDLLKRIIGP